MKAFFSFYSDALKIALQSIFAHKLRAFLTLIGIIIGVASVVTVGASISGLNTYVVDKVAKVLGSNHFMIARIAFSGQMSDDAFERANRRNTDRAPRRSANGGAAQRVGSDAAGADWSGSFRQVHAPAAAADNARKVRLAGGRQ